MIPKGVLRHAEIPRDINKWKMPTSKFGHFWPKTLDLPLEKSRFLEARQIFFWKVPIVIHRSYMYFKILNKDTRVCTLSFKFCYILHNLLLKQIFLVCNQSGLEIQKDNGMAAMLDDKTKRSVIQHGCHTIVFWISGDWLHSKNKMKNILLTCTVL